MTSIHLRSTLWAVLVAFVLAAVAACSPDVTVTPVSPPSFASAIPIHQEPGIPQEDTLVAAPPEQCMYFDPLPDTTRWGVSKGTAKGVVVHAENNIRLSLRDYLTVSGTDTVAHYGDAVIDTVHYDVLSDNSLRLDSVGAAFDFALTPAKRTGVSLHFVDLSPTENMGVDTGSVRISQITSWPPLHGGHKVQVTLKTIPTSSPPRGIVTIYGKVDSVRVGGTRTSASTGLWLDFVCYHLPKGNLEEPHPL